MPDDLIPDPSDDRVLRHVMLDGHRLMTWWTGRRAGTGQELIGYALWAPGEADPVFVGEDCGIPPGYAVDSDKALRSLLGFLTLCDGDTDDDYFAGYTPRQIEWRDREAEGLSLWATDPEESEHEPMRFEEVGR